MSKLLHEAAETINKNIGNGNEDDETKSILKQIELDLNRTMPGHELFNDGSEGGAKLRRILVAYSIHINRAIGEWNQAHSFELQIVADPGINQARSRWY